MIKNLLFLRRVQEGAIGTFSALSIRPELALLCKFLVLPNLIWVLVVSFAPALPCWILVDSVVIVVVVVVVVVELALIWRLVLTEL